MSEIHRYKAVKILTEVGNNISYTPHGPDVVMAADFDRVTAERDALQALLDESDELCDSLERSMKNHRHELGLAQRRLTAADERADLLYGTCVEQDGLLREWLNDFGRTHSALQRLKERTQAALKPAEGTDHE